MSVEYVNLNNTGNQRVAVLNEEGGVGNGTLVFNDGNAGRISHGRVHSRITGHHLGILISGTGPVMLRSFGLDYFEFGVRRR